jgi:hypothetical protein
MAVLATLMLTASVAAAAPAPPAPPLTGNCAHTPPNVEGNERTPSGNYVFFPRTGVAGHDLAWGAVSLWGGVDNLRSWCDHNATCIGYAVDTSLSQPQVWFKAAAALDYHGMTVSPGLGRIVASHYCSPALYRDR